MAQEHGSDRIAFSYRTFVLTVWDLFRNTWLYTLLFALLIRVWNALAFKLWPAGDMSFILWLKLVGWLSLWSFGMMLLVLMHAAVLEKQSWQVFLNKPLWQVIINHVCTPLLYALSISVGFFVFVLPGFYCLFAGMYFPITLHKRSAHPWGALKASFRLCTGYLLRIVKSFIILGFCFFLSKFPFHTIIKNAYAVSIGSFALEWLFIAIALVVYWQHYQWMVLLEQQDDEQV